jgi:GAF domain-containing protein
MSHPEYRSPKLLEHWQSIVEILARIIQVPSAIITRVELPFAEVIRSSTARDNPYQAGQRVRMSGHYCEHVARTRSRLILPNALADEQWKHAPEVAYGMISYLGYPILFPSGEVFGTICILDRKENQYGAEYELLVEQFKGMIEAHLALVHYRIEVDHKNAELSQRLNEIKTLRGLLPICMRCKKIRQDDGYWEQVDIYLMKHSDLEFTHGFCQECAKALYGDFLD